MAATLSPFRAPSSSTENFSKGIDSRWLKFSAKLGPCRRPRPSWTCYQLESSARVAKEVKRLQAADLQEKFGSQNIVFLDVGGRTVAQLKLKSGTSARLLVADARITSYNCLLWHGSLEEFLFTDVMEGSTDRQDENSQEYTPRQLSIMGGIGPSLTHSCDPQRSLVNSNWSLQSVQVDPQDHIQGLRRSLLFENHGFENIEVSSPRTDGDKPFVTISHSTVLSPITLGKGEIWRGAQVLFPDVRE